MEARARIFGPERGAPRLGAIRESLPALSDAKSQGAQEAKHTRTRNAAYSIGEKVGEMMQKTVRQKLDLLAHLLAKKPVKETEAAPTLGSAEFQAAAFDVERNPLGQSEAARDEYQFRVVMRRKSGTERSLAYTSDFAIARAMFSAAVKKHPDQEIKLYEGSRVVASSSNSSLRDAW
jgi:hypothetical protein